MANPLDSEPELIPFASPEDRQLLQGRVLSAEDEQAMLAEFRSKLAAWRASLKPTREQLLQVTHEENRIHARSGQANDQFWAALDADWRRKQKPDSPQWDATVQSQLENAKPEITSPPPFDLSKFDPSTLDLSHLHPFEQDRIRRREYNVHELNALLNGHNPWTESGKPKPLPSTQDSKPPNEGFLELHTNAQGKTEIRLHLTAEEESKRRKAEEEAKTRAMGEAFDYALRQAEDRARLTPGGEAHSKPEHREAVSSEHPVSILSWINSPRLRRFERWLWGKPLIAWLLLIFIVAFISFPQWGSAVWYSFSSDPPIPTIAKKMNLSFHLFQWSASWVTVPVGIVMFAALFYLLVMGKRVSEERPIKNKRDNLEIARKLKEYQEAGEKILRRCVREVVAPVAHIIYWQDEVEAYIRENVGEFQAIEFSKVAPITVYPNQALNRDLTNALYTKIERIGQIISELRPS